MLQSRVDRKRPENHQKKEKVVDAERLLDQISGEKFQRWLASEVMQNAYPEKQREQHPRKAEETRLAHAHFMETPAKHAQIQRHCRQDEQVESYPEERCAHSNRP